MTFFAVVAGVLLAVVTLAVALIASSAFELSLTPVSEPLFDPPLELQAVNASDTASARGISGCALVSPYELG